MQSYGIVQSNSEAVGVFFIGGMHTGIAKNGAKHGKVHTVENKELDMKTSKQYMNK